MSKKKKMFKETSVVKSKLTITLYNKECVKDFIIWLVKNEVFWFSITYVEFDKWDIHFDYVCTELFKGISKKISSYDVINEGE